MAGAWTTKNIKDATGTNISMRIWDESGAGAGPFSFGQVLADGAAGSIVSTAGALVRNTSGLSNRAFAATFSTLTRPANTTAYTAADSISDNATAGSVMTCTCSQRGSCPC